MKNSLTRNLQKLDRVRKLYKRFFSASWTFSITRFLTFFRKTDFFNSHRIYQHLSGPEWPGPSAEMVLVRRERTAARFGNADEIRAPYPLPFLFVAQCLHRIDSRGAIRRYDAGKQGNENKQYGNRQERRRIRGFHFVNETRYSTAEC